MNICFISSEPIPPEEGIGFYVWNLANQLTSQGHTIHIITRGGIERLSKDNIQDITLWRPRFLPVYPFHVHLHQMFTSKIVKILEDEVDLFHIHSPLSPVVSTKRPVMLTVHSAIRSDAEKTPIRDVESLLLQLQAPISVSLEKKHLRRADLVNVVAPHVADNLRGYSHCPSQIDVTWNGVDVDLFNPSQHRPPSGEGKEANRYVFSVGRLVPGKGWEDFLEAAAIVHANHPDVHFKIAGSGPLQTKLEKIVEQHNLGDVVELLGHIGADKEGRKALVRLYTQATLYAMPSHYEGLPTVLLEAMASHCPIVTTNVGGVPHIVQDEKSALLVEPQQPQRLADAINRLLTEPELCQRLGSEARRIAESRFSWPAISARYLEQYESLINKSNLRSLGAPQ